VATARDIPELASAELSFRDAASLAVGTRAAEVWEHEHGVLDTGRIEGVHDMRVATRRLRAVMEIFAPSFPKKRHREALREVKGLADALGERRDPDVMIGRLRDVSRELTNEDRPGIESLIAELEAGQADANERVARTLDEARAGKLPERLELLAAEVRA
jgi:CHAD domain-containing protein